MASAHAAKGRKLLARCGYASGGAAGAISRARSGPEDWTDNLGRVRPLRERADPQMQIKPRPTDRAMEDVYTPDLLGESGGEPLKRGRGAYARGGDVAQDKAMIAKAVHAHERADHPNTPLTKLRRGGKAKGC